ncbi:MAG: S-layer homology domain-containing protein [Clostridia bacterium]|nr:S-layer homology domain-containing protein [Clostridia bacterium]
MKRGLTLLLAVCMLITTVTTVSAASFADTAGKNCEKAVYVLSSLGIVEGKGEGAYEPESALTRAEMVTILLRAMNTEASADTNAFADVPSSHWAYKNICTAHQLKLINGISATEFAPDAPVTYEQAVKMVVALLGYAVQAEEAGGFPAGYIDKASQLDLLKGIAKGGEMNRGNMAILVYNALDKTLFEKKTYGDDSYTYTENEAATLLSKYLKVGYVREKVVASPMVRLENKNLLTDEVSTKALNEDTYTTFKMGETDIQNMVGMNVDIYYRINDETDAKICVAALPAPNTEAITVAADKVQPRTSLSTFVYDNEEGKEKEEDIDTASLKVIINGRVSANPSAADLQPAIGTVKLISNGAEGVSVIVVESYVNAIVDSVNVEDEMVYLREGVLLPGNAVEVQSIALKLSDNRETVDLLDAEGTAITLLDLAAWDVLSIAKSADSTDANSIWKIYRSYESITGTISEKKTAEKKVTIEGTEYGYDERIAADLKTGDTALYYLDFLGNVAAIDTETDTGKTYGWLVNAAVKKGMAAKAEYKIFTQDGEMKVFEGAEKLELDGVKKSQQDMVDILNNNTAYRSLVDGVTGAVIPQLVIFEANEEGTVLRKLDLADNMTGNMPDEDRFGGTFSMDFYAAEGRKAAVEWNGTKNGGSDAGEGSATEYVSGCLFGRVGIVDNTKFFRIPSDPTNDKAYSVQSARTEIDLYKYRDAACWSFYDVSEKYICGAVVDHLYLSGGNTASVVYPTFDAVTNGLITSVNIVLDEDGLEQTSLTIFNESGKTIEAVADSDLVCGYRHANADILVDPEWWTTKIVDGKEVRIYGRTEEDRKERNSYVTGFLPGSSSRLNSYYTYYAKRHSAVMNIDSSSLEVGDVIRYNIDSLGHLTLANVVYRANPNYAGSVTFSENQGRISETYRSKYYVGGALILFGTVKDKNDFGLLVNCTLAHPDGAATGWKDPYTNLVTWTYNSLKKEKDALEERVVDYSIPTSGKYVLWDRDKEEMVSITAADVVKGDQVLSLWKTNTQRLVVIYRH